MELTDVQKQILNKDEENEAAFETFLEEINTEYKDYFQKQDNKHDSITWYFALLKRSSPPAIRLRYLQPTNLDEEIKSKVIYKYKELFGEYADYQIIER